MATLFTHAYTAATLGLALTPGRVLPRVLVVGALCAALPDLDVVGFGLGIGYGDLLGHRGLSHSLAFAAVLAPVLVALLFRGPRWSKLRGRLVLYLFLATASHGVLDALTNGGLGVAFFSPFDETRYFFPFTPVLVSPIGVRAFFDARAFPVLFSELWWIWAPWTIAAVSLYAVARRAGRRRDVR